MTNPTVEHSSPASSSESSAGRIGVTGSVPPTVTTVSVEPGAVSEIVINTAERDPRLLLFTARTSLGPDGRPVDLDAATWRAARAALAKATPGTGTIWRREGERVVAGIGFQPNRSASRTVPVSVPP